jgi:hypothetical protein
MSDQRGINRQRQDYATGDRWIRTRAKSTSPDPTGPCLTRCPTTGCASQPSVRHGKRRSVQPAAVESPPVQNSLRRGLIVGGTQQSGIPAHQLPASRIRRSTRRSSRHDLSKPGSTALADRKFRKSASAPGDRTLNGGIRILGGSGNDTVAQIDPVNQTILVNGGIDVIGGSGTNAIAQIVNGTGAQTLLATNGNSR